MAVWPDVDYKGSSFSFLGRHWNSGTSTSRVVLIMNGDHEWF